jgi:hypothetical protein
MQDLQEIHWKVIKGIFHYFKGTYQLGIKYCNNNIVNLVSRIVIIIQTFGLL